MLQLLQIDEKLLGVLIKATRDGLAMAGLKPTPIGVNKNFYCHRAVSAIVGFAGQTSGSLIVNVSEEGACYLSSQMIGEELRDLNTQTLDGICEIANIIAGQTKAVLSTTEHKFERISTPSVIVGSNYFIRNYRGMNSISVEFELPGLSVHARHDYGFTVSMGLMKI